MPRTPSLLVVLALLVAGCGREAAPPPVPEPQPTLRLAVSHDVGLLVERWNRAMGEEAAGHVHVDVTADSLAYAALLDGAVHAALVHRRATPAEDRRARGNDLIDGDGFTYLKLAETPVSLLVHVDNPVQVVTVQQAAGLLGGWLSSWAEVGGSDAEVRRFVREADTATWQVVDAWLGEAKPASGQTLPDARAVATAVAGLPASLGTGGGLPGRGVRSLGLRLTTGELIMPMSTAGSGAVWPLQRSLVLVTRGPRRSLVDGWVAKITTPEARAMAEQNGYVLAGPAP